MRASSSSEKEAFSNARRLSSICAAELAPTITDVTHLSRRSHASAISASVWPRCRAMSFRARSRSQHRVGQHLALQRTTRRHARILRNAVEVTTRQQSLRQRRKGDEARTRRGGKAQPPGSFGLAAEDIVPVLKKQARNVAFGEVAEGETRRRFERVARQSDVERLAPADDVDQCLEGLPQGASRVVAVGIEDVDVIRVSCGAGSGRGSP